MDSDADWEYLGRSDPYWAVVASSRLLTQNLDSEAKSKFFDLGQRHVDRMMDIVRIRLLPGFTPARVLDYGCGVGRMLIPFASIAQRVVGADVSSGMLEEAARNCGAQGAANVELVHSDDSLSGISGRFDLIHSFNVFQHISPGRGERIAGRLLSLLDDGGVGILHLTYFRKASWMRNLRYWARKNVPLLNGLANLLRGPRPSHARPLIQMNAYDVGKLYRLLQESGCHRVYTEFSHHAFPRDQPRLEVYGIVLFFQKVRLTSW